MKQVLLTGASGFIGRHAIPFLLRKEYQIHAVYYNSKPDIKKEHKIIWHHADLLNLEGQKQLITEIKPTHLLHFAWYAVPGKYWTSFENIRWVQASLGLITNFAENGGKRVVFIGTCAEYDWNYGYCSEEITPLKPATLYGVCKNSLYEMIKHFSNQRGVSYAWGRIFFPYGPYENSNRLISSITASLLKGEPARCTHGNQIRDLLHVEDVASASVDILQSEVQGPVNIASGLPVSLKEVVCKIGGKIGRLDLICLNEMAAPPDDPPLLVGDIRKLRERVNWSPRYSLDAGLDQTIQWWKDHLCRGER